jgi:endonuclease/exonuclease/phosphatase family metal-dependent hydrolase
VKNIKIITINTWKCDGNYHARMRILANQLKALAPDIIACQECFYSSEGKADTLKFLTDELKMHLAFLPGRYKKRFFDDQWVESISGLGILSAYPITRVNHFNLPAAPGDEDRKVLQTEITLSPEIKLMVTNTHLTHLSSAVNARQAQAKVLAGVVKADKSSNYHIVCGDFNSAIDSVEMKTLMSKSRMTDCYAAGQGAKPRYSLTDAFKNNKLICVDHIFALPLPSKRAYPEFTDSAVVLNEPDAVSGLYPSDHFGISTTLVIP